MHTKVVHRAARLLADRFSLAALRFNFRGVGTSAGEFDDGRGETDDVVAAYEFLRSRQPAGSAVLSGFSFGSTCALRAARITQPDALLLIGLPVDLFREDEGWGLEGVKVVWVHGEEDQFGTGASAAALAERLGWTLRRIPRCDHFFTGRLDAFEDASVELLAGAGIPVTSGKEADDDEDA